MGDLYQTTPLTPPLLTPESLVPRLGDYLVENGIITRPQLDEALSLQSSGQSQGQRILLGEVLISLGYINRGILDQAITEQIMQLRAALQESNQQLERRVQERTQELQDALRKLSELNQLKSNLIANISHELRTPLTHIKGYIELLFGGVLGDLNTQQLAAIQVVQRATDRLEQQIDDLIRYSLASRGEFTLRFALCDLPDLFNQIIQRCLEKASEKSIQLQSTFSGRLPPVVCDAEKLSWALLQLVDNAIKFTASGGKVILGACPVEDQIEISISDTGIGIPKDRQEEIFEPFHQLDGSATRRYGGTGLGLALVKQIVDAHGSKIRLDSSLNKGSRFSFFLPVAILR
jgi:signal transduction histidine kinase